MNAYLKLHSKTARLEPEDAEKSDGSDSGASGEKEEEEG